MLASVFGWITVITRASEFRQTSALRQNSGTRRVFSLSALLLVVAAHCFCADAQATPDAVEAARIDRLIDHVALQADIRFIRNGEVFEASAAAAHLRAKMSSAGWRIKTADHFIDYLASRSSMSGTMYEIRLADGRLVLARDWLRGELKVLDKQGAGK